MRLVRDIDKLSFYASILLSTQNRLQSLHIEEASMTSQSTTTGPITNVEELTSLSLADRSSRERHLSMASAERLVMFLDSLCNTPLILNPSTPDLQKEILEAIKDIERQHQETREEGIPHMPTCKNVSILSYSSLQSVHPEENELFAQLMLEGFDLRLKQSFLSWNWYIGHLFHDMRVGGNQSFRIIHDGLIDPWIKAMEKVVSLPEAISTTIHFTINKVVAALEMESWEAAENLMFFSGLMTKGYYFMGITEEGEGRTGIVLTA